LPGGSFQKYIKDNNIKITKTLYKNKYYEEAIKYCENKFKNYYKHYDSSNIYYIPITHDDSKAHLKTFIKEKLNYFGQYQDYVDKDEREMFHSFISPMLNNGLLTPQFVMDSVLKSYHKDNLYSIEGFIRQLNWREYSRYLYRFNKDMKKNYFNNTNKLNNEWYNGTLNILPIDTLIKKAFLTGYLHHIERLMFMCNFMNLCQINPDDVYYWFMAFSLDSYDWVMINNVYSMGLYADGGTSTTKPYISSNNYITKMSNFKKGEWSLTWYVLYYYFIYKNYRKLEIGHTFFRSQYDKLKPADKNDIISQGKKILS
jgi:deoxyribodipyrimidine photolyase-related protein